MLSKETDFCISVILSNEFFWFILLFLFKSFIFTSISPIELDPSEMLASVSDFLDFEFEQFLILKLLATSKF